MLELNRKKAFLNIKEVFFHEDEKLEDKYDIKLLKQAKNPFKGSSEFITLHINLLNEEEEIQSAFKKNTKYEIRRAQGKDNLEFISINQKSMNDVDEIVDFYNQFANSKGIGKCNDTLIRRLISVDALTITQIRKDKSILAIHFYITDSKRARLLYSGSQFRNTEDKDVRSLIGRANRFLHWKDIIYFKNEGFSILDLGGIAEDENNSATQNIDAFKKSFGGERVVEYTGKVDGTLLGKIALRMF